MLKEKNYVLYSKKIKQDSEIIMFSDIHYMKGYCEEKLNSIVDYVKFNNPDYVCIPGDIIEDLNSPKDLVLESFLKNIADCAPTIVSLGNHDIMAKCDKKWVKSDCSDYISFLKSINNIHVLDDSIQRFSDSGISFTGLTMPFEYYENERESSVAFNELLLKKGSLLSASNYYFDLMNCFDSSLLEIVLLHSPTNLVKSGVLSDFDIVLSGHMHGGVVPTCIESFIGNYGIVSPVKKFFPSHVRGLTKSNDTSIIVSSGIQRMNLPFSDKIFTPEVTKIMIKKK